MSAIFFGKELVSNPVLVNGVQVPFEVLDGNRGVIKLDTVTNKTLVDGLNKLASEQRGGVYQIDEAEYTKKKQQFPPRSPKFGVAKEMLRAMPDNKNPFKRAEASVAAGEKPVPVEEMPAPPVEQLAEPVTPAPKPPTARVGKRGKLAEAIQSTL